MELKCDLVKDLLPLYVEDLCSDTSKKIVNDHIADCQSCNRLLTDLSNKNDVVVDKSAVKKSLMPFRKIKRRNLLITVSGILCTILVISALFCKLFLIGSVVSPPEITATNLEMIDTLTFEIELELSQDSNIYAIKNIALGKSDNTGNVYVRGTKAFVSPFNPKSHYETTFGFDEDSFGSDKIKAVYLIGNNKNDIKLIWQDN